MSDSIPIRSPQKCPICNGKKMIKAALCERCTKFDQAKKHHRRTIQGVINIFSEAFQQMFMQAYDKTKTPQETASCLDGVRVNLEKRTDSHDNRNRLTQISRAWYIFEQMSPSIIHPQDDPPSAA